MLRRCASQASVLTLALPSCNELPAEPIADNNQTQQVLELEVLDLLGTKAVQAGVIDVATETVETPEEVAATIGRIRADPDQVVARHLER